MALPGFELLHSNISSSLRSIDDAAIAAVHWNLITNGLKCCGSGESWQGHQCAGSELLPEAWNSDSSVFSLRYVDPKSDRKYLMKAVVMDGTLMLYLIRTFDEKTVSSSIRSRDFVNDQFSSFRTAYTNLEDLNSQLTAELYNSLVGESSSSSSSSKANTSSPKVSSSSSSSRQQQPGRSPLLEDPRRGVPPGGIGFTPPRYPQSSVDPLAVGRADLDPLAGGRGGGMFMDPLRSGAGGVGGPFNPFGPGRQGFPPGSVPPGARFDPIGPPGMRPNPDPDHERPPGYDDMFM